MSQTQPVKWIICWRNKYENIFTHINIPHMKEEKKTEKKEQIWGNYVDESTSHEATRHLEQQ